MAGDADDAGQARGSPAKTVHPGGTGSRSAGPSPRRDRRRPDRAVLRRQPRAFLGCGRAPFATPSDRWWPALHESGFTPRRLAPHEARELLALSLGLTSLVRRPTVGVAELAKTEFAEGGRLLRRRVLTRRPQWLAVLGVTAYRAAFGRPDAAVGLQEDTGSTRLWILPNPSGLNAHTCGNCGRRWGSSKALAGSDVSGKPSLREMLNHPGGVAHISKSYAASSARDSQPV
jgi:TDG/mug DNA glycosylase family protein